MVVKELERILTEIKDPTHEDLLRKGLTLRFIFDINTAKESFRDEVLAHESPEERRKEVQDYHKRAGGFKKVEVAQYNFLSDEIYIIYTLPYEH